MWVLMLTVVIVVVLAFAFLVYRKMGATSDRSYLEPFLTNSQFCRHFQSRHPIQKWNLTTFAIHSFIHFHFSPIPCMMLLCLDYFWQSMLTCKRRAHFFFAFGTMIFHLSHTLKTSHNTPISRMQQHTYSFVTGKVPPVRISWSFIT